MKTIRDISEAIGLLSAQPMKLTTLDEHTQELLKAMPYEFGEPVMSDYTFGPALTWVFIFKDLPFSVYTDLDGNWQIDARRNAHWSIVDEFIFELINTLA